jgi:hypothetical protein
MTKKVSEYFKKRRMEWFLVTNSSDEFIVESYSHCNSRAIKRISDFIDRIINTCDVMSVRKIVAPKKTNPVSIAKLVSRVKYLKEHASVKFKSCKVESIVGSNEVWLYDTEKRRLFKYVAEDGMTLTVKGTTIMNFSVENSGSKIVRKLETLDNVSGMTKRPLNKLYTELAGVTKSVTGRTNEHQIIVNTF